MATKPAGGSGPLVEFARGLAGLGVSTARVTRGFGPLLRLLSSPQPIARPALAAAVDRAFAPLYAHPLLQQTERLTELLRRHHVIPDEQGTEKLIRLVIEQLTARAPMAVPAVLVEEFWSVFDTLMASPEVGGLGTVTLDMLRLVIDAYEPQLVEIINLLKDGRRFNQWQMAELRQRAAALRGDARIIRRQLQALRHVRAFFQADPADFHAQSQIVARMVREFGPLFVKLAQVAAASADFLPEALSRELAAFHEDVPPMRPEDVVQAFIDHRGVPPQQLYLGFDPARPLRSGAIGAVFVARKPFAVDGQEVLKPVIVKVGRPQLEREFAIGRLVVGLAIVSSRYWAPHSRLVPFLHALQAQVDEFVGGFAAELDFEAEARNQRRFAGRTRADGGWTVPRIFASDARIIEMEYLEGWQSLGKAVEATAGDARCRRRLQSRVSRQLLHAVLEQMLVFGELHGDLHPGNIMIGPEQRLALIDWGSVVRLDGRWPLLRDYLVAALLADTALLTDALVAMSTTPGVDAAARQRVTAALDQILQGREVERLSAAAVLRELRQDACGALRRRASVALQMLTNSRPTGLVMHRDYAQLSRALMAVLGSFVALYPASGRAAIWRDLAWAAAAAPLSLVRDAWRFHANRPRNERSASAAPRLSLPETLA